MSVRREGKSADPVFRRGRPTIASISGNTTGLKSNQFQKLKNLANKRIRENVVVSQDFARALCSISSEIGRQVGALVNRQGYVDTIIVGDAHRIFIPDLERKRAVRLRGLRLVHTHLFQEALSPEDLYDLTLLRLDYITAVTFDQDALPFRFFSAHVSPGQNPGYIVEEPVAPGRIREDFREVIEDLENRFRQEADRTRDAAGRPRAFLVGIYTPARCQVRSPEDSMQELRELCATADVVAVDHFIQRRGRIDAVTMIGSGKLKEITIRAVQEDVELLIFDAELSPAQASRISALCDLKIIDRTQLILDIFARNAKSRDGKLQVELAQLNYLKERLSEKDDNMSRLVGGVGGRLGIGGRGPGETILEIGRRRVKERIHRLEKELKNLRQRRELNRQQRTRTDIPIVSIIGYTNAGKSTLLNALTNSAVLAEDRLFATLDPTTRRIRFPEEREIILSDTVGFIQELPPELSRAFQATLEELADSDLLLHCIDASDPRQGQKTLAVEGILGDLKLLDIPCIRIYNKCDLLSAEERASLAAGPDSMTVSAMARDNLRAVLEAIERTVLGPVGLPA